MQELLSQHPKLYEFLNADEIAHGLAPLHPDSVAFTASKLMIGRLRHLLETEKNFAFETTGAGKNYINYLKTAQAKNYQIKLIFLWLQNVNEAVYRVTQRVRQGGHAIPEETIRRRYFLGIKNLFDHYLPLAHTAFILDNSSETSEQRTIASKENGEGLKILNESLWEQMQRVAYGR